MNDPNCDLTEPLGNETFSQGIWRAGGFLGAAALIWWGMCSGSQANFLDWPSLSFTLGGTLGLLLAVYGSSGTVSALRSLFLGAPDDSRRAEAAAYFRLAGAFALAFGFLGTLVGLMKMLANMEDPSSIGSGICLALLTQLYGVVLAIVCCAATAIIERRSVHGASIGEHSKQSLRAAGTAVAVGTLATMLAISIVMVSMMELGR